MALGLTTESSSTNKIYDRLGYNAKDGVYTHSYYDRENEIRENEEYKKCTPKQQQQQQLHLPSFQVQ